MFHSAQGFLQNRLPELAVHVDAHVAKLTEDLRKEAWRLGFDIATEFWILLAVAILTPGFSDARWMKRWLSDSWGRWCLVGTLQDACFDMSASVLVKHPALCSFFSDRWTLIVSHMLF